MRTPDLTQRVIGYRQWNVDSDYNLKAVGMTAAKPWVPGPQHAVCLASNSGYRMPCLPVADPDCHCGFYALHKLEDAHGYGGLSPRSYGAAGVVQGIVTGWGRLAVHREGYRAEYIEVMAIICPDEKMVSNGPQECKRFPHLYQQVAKKYNVPLIKYSNAESYATEFGARMPESLMPKSIRGYDDDEDDYYKPVDVKLSGEMGLTELRHATGSHIKWIEDQKHPSTRDLPKWITDVMDELDPSVPEAMAGLYDIYVPNLGDLLIAVNEPPKPNYLRFPEDPIKPHIIDLADPRGRPFSVFLATNGCVAYLPMEI